MSADRKVHFVGTMPQFESPEDALRWQIAELSEDVRRLSGGETGARLAWFVPMVKELKSSGKIRTVRDGDWTDYEDTDRLAARRGVRLTAEDIPLQLARWAREELRVLDEIGTQATPARPLQIGVPGYLDMALFTFGPAGVPRHGRAFLDAVDRQIAEIAALAGDRVVFQLETPAALIAVATAPKALRPMVADALSRMVLRQVARAPAGTRFGLHLCLGDMGHRAKLHLRTAEPLVALANALVRRWPRDRALEFVHLPFSGGERPPSTEPGFYEPLRNLVAGDSVIAAGIAHEDQPESEQLQVRELVESAIGRPVDIATACGLGRRTPARAHAAVDRMRALLA